MKKESKQDKITEYRNAIKREAEKQLSEQKGKARKSGKKGSKKHKDEKEKVVENAFEVPKKSGGAKKKNKKPKKSEKPASESKIEKFEEKDEIQLEQPRVQSRSSNIRELDIAK